MVKINKERVLIKLHYFLFLAALGPILPFLNVIGKQLQISEMVMGLINAVLPLLVLVAKPSFGLLIDLLHKLRKLLFMLIVFRYSSLVLSPWRPIKSDQLNWLRNYF
ncbi:uncharacterized protein LOC103519966 [Diaphorina citri]|uniref:Uncharacterized protein LOC103519966 n=1 Tax=Diaphorina citri TaxID=121845 RepID=A0A3Q0JF20_DIACI|nr:uncharacterized protein LOC103519966 [Diaphorina citri]